MGFNTVTGITHTSTTAEAPVGMITEEQTEGATNGPRGRRVWIYVKNAEASAAFAVGTVCARAAGLLYDGVKLSAVSGTAAGSATRVCGVAQHAIPAGSYGWILREGYGFVLGDATGYAADSPLIPDASTTGCAQAGTETGAAFGISVVVQTGAGATGTAFLACRG